MDGVAGEAVVAELEAVRAVLGGLVAGVRGASSWDGTTRARVLGLLDRLPGLVVALRAPVLVAQHEAARTVGAERELLDVRARSGGTSRFGAAREVGAARALEALPQVRAGVAAAQVPVGHVAVLSRALEGADEKVVAAFAAPGLQERVVDLARETGVREFARAVAVLVAELDPDRLDETREDARRARFLTLTHAAEGTFLKGRVDAVAGEALARALDATGHREDDDRTREQARADALVALAQHALAGGREARPPSAHGEVPRAPTSASDEDLPDGSVRAPVAQVSLVVPAEAWFDARRRRDGGATPGSDGTGAQRDLARARRAVATTEDGTVLSATELATALCDCELRRVVVDERGLPLDVGRARRMFTPAQRAAVVVRDRVCAWNGCSIVPRHCELHHIRWWDRDGGRSDLENAVLLCSHHHHQVHRLDLDVRRRVPGAADLARSQVVAAVERGRPPGPVRYEFVDRLGRVRNGPARDDEAVVAGAA